VAALALHLGYASSQRFQGLIFNSEAVLALPSLLGCLLAVVAMRERRLTLFGPAGACVGLAIAAKPVGAALLIPLLLAPLLAPPLPRPFPAGSGNRAWKVRGLLLALAGALLPLLGFGLVLWRQGALAAAYQGLVVYNRIYAAESAAGGWDPSYLWRIWAPMLTLVLPAFAGLAAALLRREWRTPAHAVAALWGLALLATAVLSLRAYPHYYLAAVPLLALWAGAGIALLGRWILRTRLRWLAVPVALLALAALLASPQREVAPLRAQTPYEQIGALYGPEGYGFFGHADAVATYIAQRVPPGQPIFVWAAEPEIYYLAERRPAARFIYDYPLEHIPGARDELLAALRQTLPPLIVTYHDVRPIGFHPFMPDHGYALRATIGGYDVYERNAG
jgi:hypothetical protein